MHCLILVPTPKVQFSPFSDAENEAQRGKVISQGHTSCKWQSRVLNQLLVTATPIQVPIAPTHEWQVDSPSLELTSVLDNFDLYSPLCEIQLIFPL